MFAYNFDSQGLFTGVVPRQKSPLEEGVFLMPANATDVEPPAIPEGKQARWNGSEWALEDAPAPQSEPEEVSA